MDTSIVLTGIIKSNDELLIVKRNENDDLYVVIDVFAYNNLAIKFYNKQGYHTRGLVDIKRL